MHGGGGGGGGGTIKSSSPASRASLWRRKVHREGRSNVAAKGPPLFSNPPVFTNNRRLRLHALHPSLRTDSLREKQEKNNNKTNPPTPLYLD